MASLFAFASGFAFAYPVIMSFLWISGGLHHYLRREHRGPTRQQPPAFEGTPPFVTVLVPCHDEGDNVRETLAAALAQRWPAYEVIAINDGSRDDTGAQLDRLAAEHAALRVIHLDRNLGKANALRMGVLAARSEYLVCIDGDALLDPHALHWMVHPLATGAGVGAVTGNPRIRNRSTLLGRMQVAEFSSIIGMIKRTQLGYGRIFTVSGVICAFRRTALHDVGYWADDMLTEDIDISWRLQLAGWQIRYEPNALCFILMPETLRGLWRQRLRWAQGGLEVLRRHGPRVLAWGQRRMWPIALEYLLSVLWAYTVACLALAWLGQRLAQLPARTGTPVPGYTELLMLAVCMLQFGCSLLIDRRYERHVGRTYFWVAWYPLAYWLISATTTLAAMPMHLLRRRGKRATWTSPDRGLR